MNMPAQKAAKMMQKRTSVHLRFSMSCGDETRRSAVRIEVESARNHSHPAAPLLTAGSLGPTDRSAAPRERRARGETTRTRRYAGWPRRAGVVGAFSTRSTRRRRPRPRMIGRMRRGFPVWKTVNENCPRAARGFPRVRGGSRGRVIGGDHPGLLLFVVFAAASHGGQSNGDGADVARGVPLSIPQYPQVWRHIHNQILSV